MLEPSRVGFTAQGRGNEIEGGVSPLFTTIESESGRLCFFHNSFVNALSMHKLDDLASEPVNEIFFFISSV